MLFTNFCDLIKSFQFKVGIQIIFNFFYQRKEIIPTDHNSKQNI